MMPTPMTTRVLGVMPLYHLEYVRPIQLSPLYTYCQIAMLVVYSIAARWVGSPAKAGEGMTAFERQGHQFSANHATTGVPL